MSGNSRSFKKGYQMSSFVERVKYFFIDLFGDREERLERERIKKISDTLKILKERMPDWEIWKRIDALPGGDKNPFETPFGPTGDCLSSNEVVAFVKRGEIDQDVLEHLEGCKECREHIDRFKKVYP